MKRIKNKVMLFTTILFATMSYCQNGNFIIKTGTGFFAVHNSDELSFTLRVDGDSIQVPEWIDDYTLNLINDHLTLSLFTTNEILKNNKNLSNNEKLLAFQKWETDYIDENFSKDIERSKYIKDTLNFGLENLYYNAWYYSFKMDDSEIYCYFFDILYNDNFFRLIINFVPNLQIPREMAEVIFSNLTVFETPIDIQKLQQDIINGKY
jgi:hypothetical protein